MTATTLQPVGLRVSRRLYIAARAVCQAHAAREGMTHEQAWVQFGDQFLTVAKTALNAAGVFQLEEAASAAWTCIAELPPTQARVEVAQMLLAAVDLEGHEP